LKKQNEQTNKQTKNKQTKVAQEAMQLILFVAKELIYVKLKKCQGI